MPSFADTDGASLKVVEELTYGAGPALNSLLWKQVRAKSWDLTPNINVVESEQISQTVEILDAITVAKMASFSMTAEYTKDAVFELYLEHLFRSAFTANVLKNGILKKSLAFEETTIGAATEYAVAQGIRMNSMTMTGAVGRIIDCAFTGSSASYIPAATSQLGTGTVAAAPTARPLSLTDLTAFTMTGDVLPLTVLDFNLTITNNTREQMGAGSAALQGIGYGTKRVTGSFHAYFESREQLTKLLAGTRSDLNFVMTDGTNTHTWRLPNIKYLKADKPVTGRSADVTHRFDFIGIYDTTQATSVMVTRT
jgi:hypothetical protein